MSSTFRFAGFAFALLAFSAAAEPPQEGMTVVRDPQTGQLRAPTAQELRALRAKEVVSPDLAPRPSTKVRPDGTRALDLGERGMVYATTTRAPDGTLVRKCVQGEAAAKDAMQRGEGARHEHE